MVESLEACRPKLMNVGNHSMLLLFLDEETSDMGVNKGLGKISVHFKGESRAHSYQYDFIR